MWKTFTEVLSDIKFPQVSWTLLRIQAVLNTVVAWTVSTCPLISKSPNPFNNPFVTVPRASITIGINSTFIFHSFSNSLAKSRYLSFFSFSFNFSLCSAGTAKFTILQVLFFFCTPLRAFHISVSRWSSPGAWVTTILLKYPGLYSVFWQILTVV